jgi:hypothetical protein
MINIKSYNIMHQVTTRFWHTLSRKRWLVWGLPCLVVALVVVGLRGTAVHAAPVTGEPPIGG